MTHIIRTFRVLYAFAVLVERMKLALGLVPGVGVGDGHIWCIETERQALLKIKQDLVDDYGHLSSWGGEEGKKDCCKWRGIWCSNHTGHVTTLDLHVTEVGNIKKPLRGKISHSLLELRHLNYVDLSCNDFQGALLPNFNGSLSKLRYLNVSNVGLIGTLSYQLRNLSSLQSLDLSNNKFSSVEKLEWLSHLSFLQVLDFSGNNLGKGSHWLQVVSKLPYLKTLRLRSCGLENTVPVSNSHINSSTSLSVIDFSSNSLSSSVFQWVLSLNSSSLVDINLSDNQLEGSIPYALQKKTSLTSLNLSSNGLKGTIPSFFGNFCSLHTLDLSRNNLTGDFPEFFKHLSTCAEKSLEILKLEVNQLHGALPDFTTFSSLKQLMVYSNHLNGSFPKKFGQISGLLELDVGDNQLEGSLPDLSMLPSLKKLCVVYNKLNGTITESLGGLSKLEILWVSHNFFQGVVTEAHFSNLSRLRQMYLNDNPLALKFNSNWIPPFKLDIIGFNSINLGPHFPEWLQTQTNYLVLDISDARIAGSVPQWFWNLSHRIFFLNISFNLLSGKVPDLSSHFVGNPGIDLSSNLFEGHLPVLPSNATSLNFSKNKFMGSISSVCTGTGRALNFLDLSENLLSGEIPDDCFMNKKQLVVLNLALNNLSGKIPTSVGSLSSLQSFGLRNNNFSGEIPTSLMNCSSLIFLDLSYNKLSGKLPAWIGNSQVSLLFLNLQSNEFHGSMPVELCWLQNILLLDLSLNNISGTIPHCLRNFTVMTGQQLDDHNYYSYIYSSSSVEGSSFQGIYLDKALVGWKGRLYEYQKNLNLLRIINLAANRLSGEIPREITKLTALVGLNLSRNDFTGKIPEKIGRLNRLQWLDLSRNRLSGGIPVSTAKLNFLGYIDLSYNNMSGRIPTSTQLQSFNASAFAGNHELCGFPVPRKCPDDDRSQERQSTGDSQDKKEKDEEFSKWFYAGLASGWSVGFWGFVGILVLRSSWRHSFFQFVDKLWDLLYVTIRINTRFH